MQLPKYGSTHQSLVHNSFFWRVAELVNKLPLYLFTVKDSAAFKNVLRKIGLLNLLDIEDLIDLPYRIVVIILI